MSVSMLQRRLVMTSATFFARTASCRSLHVSSIRLSDRVDDQGSVRKKESIHETESIKKEELRVLREMLLRQEREGDPTGARATAAVKDVLKKHGIPDNKQSLIDDLVKWRVVSH